MNLPSFVKTRRPRPGRITRQQLCVSVRRFMIVLFGVVCWKTWTTTLPLQIATSLTTAASIVEPIHYEPPTTVTTIPGGQGSLQTLSRITTVTDSDINSINSTTASSTTTAPDTSPTTTTTTSPTADYDIGLSFLPQSSNQNWQIWNASSTAPLYNNRGWRCEWLQYTRPELNNQSAEICGHTDRDIVSQRIQQTQQWDCCGAVRVQYHAAVQDYTNSRRQYRVLPVHIEIGANIGACVVELLLSDPDIHVVAFEPYPTNLFRLTSTLLRNPDFHKRVTVFPIGLGSRNSTVRMAVEQDHNYGSARIQGPVVSTNTAVKTNKGTAVTNNGDDEQHHTVTVERLDNVLAISDPNSLVASIKADVQGFECKVLSGMPMLLPRVARIVTELDHGPLKQQGCSGAGLMKRLSQHHSRPRWIRGNGKLQPIGDKLPANVNVVAIKL